jgi:hypothetical protein
VQSAGGDAPEISDAHHPGGAREDDRFTTAAATVSVEVGAWQEQHGEYSIDEMKERRGTATQGERRQPDQSLQRRQAGHDEVAGAKARRHRCVPKVLVGPPNRHEDREHEERTCAETMQEGEGGGQQILVWPKILTLERSKPVRGSSRR